MASQNPRTAIYEPKTLAAMDQAFSAIWNVVTADDPFRDYANDSQVEGCHRAEAFEPCGGWSDRS